ncbi:39S ribosomal protein L18, mitochondrial [Glossina fuscipes]|uniref:Large ribosomal subunit protein uL18m n=1 Tax=Glossina fuscipes TaxID=7396 RepID=A0A9C6DVU6_9MUSC|nr:39S ribosomal protein L18, mitochondrial [Glossina fuscipes]
MTARYKAPYPAYVLRKVKQLIAPKEDAIYMINRNPRNLERLRIGYKPDGFHLEKPGRSFWHKLEVNVSGRSVTAEVKHFQNGAVITASTSEWAIQKQLFKTKDTSAFINLARVLAMRCQQSGITEMSCNVEAVPNSKVDKFLKTIQQEGINLKELPRYKLSKPWDVDRPDKPWEILEEHISKAKSTPNKILQ